MVKTYFRRVQWHWRRFNAPGLPVTFPTMETKDLRWRGIYGAQIGPWFIGVVRGEPGKPYDAEADTTLAFPPSRR